MTMLLWFFRGGGAGRKGVKKGMEYLGDSSH